MNKIRAHTYYNTCTTEAYILQIFYGRTSDLCGNQGKVFAETDSLLTFPLLNTYIVLHNGSLRILNELC